VATQETRKKVPPRRSHAARRGVPDKIAAVGIV
jgi:hypothetical protein